MPMISLRDSSKLVFGRFLKKVQTVSLQKAPKAKVMLPENRFLKKLFYKASGFLSYIPDTFRGYLKGRMKQKRAGGN
jgi:hypothetical protein